MASFNYTVDTRPMADEISTVSRHVNTTTGAVVAMQIAVIEAEAQAADHICDNVNRGFYSLIRSQISQKVARLQSEVDSHLMQLNQQKQGLLSIRMRMQRDYNMITGRYVKLFNGLNSNLKSRVFDLDRPAIDFVTKEVNKLSNRSKYLTATVPVTQLESIAESQKILASNIKQKGIAVINSMKNFIHEMNVQKILTDKILIDDISLARPGSIYMPVLIFESNIDKTDHKNIDFKIPEIQLSAFTKSSISNLVYDKFATLSWAADTGSAIKVSAEFARLVQNSGTSDRVKNTAQQLFQSAIIQTI